MKVESGSASAWIREAWAGVEPAISVIPRIWPTTTSPVWTPTRTDSSTPCFAINIGLRPRTASTIPKPV